jgi:hypothetical protein
MNKKDEALRMAIEALEITEKAFIDFTEALVGLGVPATILKLDKQSKLTPAIQCCKEALERPTQEAPQQEQRLEALKLVKDMFIANGLDKKLPHTFETIKDAIKND